MEPLEIKKLRQRLGLSIRGLAKEMGIAFSTVARWESGRVKPSPLAQAKLRELQTRSQEKV